MPLVTVITPVYNCEKYIGETINSVINQSYKNIRYLVVDDGSTDSTPSILKSYDGIIEVIRQDNAGEQIAVNRGLSKVKGEYFMIVNADDPLLPGCIETLVDAMDSNPMIFCAYPDIRIINESGDILQHIKTREYDYTFMVKNHKCLPSVGAICRSSVIEIVGYRDNTFCYVGDFDYWLRVGLVGNMLRMPIELACWRETSLNKSSQINHIRAAEHIVLMDKFFSLPSIPVEILGIKKEAYGLAYLTAFNLSGTILEKLEYAVKSFISYPRYFINIGFWYVVFKHMLYYIWRYVTTKISRHR